MGNAAMKKEERVLLYQFPAEQISTAQDVLRALGIHVQILRADAWREKVGYLLGRKGFRATQTSDADDFAFSHRLLLLENIQGKRLTKILDALQEVGIPHITYKSVITPYNMLWTLRYLCEHMEKEHAPSGDLLEGDIR